MTTATRSEVLPDLPAVGDFVPGYESSGFFGAPKNTPAEIIDKLNREINAAFADHNIRARLADVGPTLAGLPAEFGKLIADETKKWGKVIRAANIKAEWFGWVCGLPCAPRRQHHRNQPDVALDGKRQTF